MKKLKTSNLIPHLLQSQWIWRGWLFLFLASPLIGFAQLPADPQLSLPWAPGEKWYLHHGVHTSTGVGNGPLSSIDFAPGPGASNRVLAARRGKVVHVTAGCARGAIVILNHGDGWFTSYYHLTNLPANILDPPASGADVWVDRHQFIGELAMDEATATPCANDSWTAPHVHMSLRNSSSGGHQDMVGKKIGGWEVLNEFNNEGRKSGIKKNGFTVRRPTVNVNVYSPASLIYNDQAIGTGEFSTHQLCKDHSVDGIYNANERVIVSINRDVDVDADFRIFSIANVVAGHSILLTNGFRAHEQTGLIFKVDDFNCANFPSIAEEQEHLALVGETRSAIPAKKETSFIQTLPNPFTHSFQLHWQCPTDAGAIALTINNLNGQELFREDWRLDPQHSGYRDFGAQDYWFARLSSGIYFVQLQLENGERLHRKIVKQ